MAMKLDIKTYELSEEDSWRLGELQELLPAVQDAARRLDAALDTITDGIENLDDNWYSENAENFGNTFVNAYKNVITTTNEYVNSCGEAIVEAGRYWASKGNTSYDGSWAHAEARATNANFQVTDSAGSRGANTGSDATFESVTGEGVSGVESALSAFSNVVNSSRAFSTSNNAALSATVDANNEAVRNWHNNNTEGFKEIAKKEIKGFIDANSSVTSAFSSEG